MEVKKEYCKVCGEPLFWETPNKTLVRAICSCEEKILAEEKEKKRQREYYKEYKDLACIDIRGEKFKNVYLKDFEVYNDNIKEVYGKVKDYIKDILKGKKNSIYLYGKAGTGKSMLSAIIVNQLAENKVPAIMTNFIEIKNKIFEGDGEHIKNLLKRINLLVIDDIGVEYIKSENNSYTQELIYEIINYRYANKKPVVFSSNYSITQLVDEKDIHARTVQRMAEMCKKDNIIEINQESYRVKLFNKK